MLSSRLILARYFAREILQTTLAVSLVLLLIFLSGRFAKYLADAATGAISADIILKLLLYRTPNILERVLPLALFLAILLVYGRMYVENEISALQAAGLSVPRLLWISGLAITPAAFVTALLTLYVSPAGFQKVERMLNHEKERSELELVEPGKFLQLRARHGVMYTGEVASDRRSMKDIFIVQQHIDGQWTMLRAKSGYQKYDSATDSRFMTLEHGARFTFMPGEAAGERLRFAGLQQRMLPPDEYDPRKLKEDTISTSLLIKESWRPAFMATLQWRFSLIILVPLVAMLAVAMSRTTPRQGRYIKLLPAMLLYFAYMATLDVLRRKVEEGDWPATPGLLVAHLLFLGIALMFLYGDKMRSWRRTV